MVMEQLPQKNWVTTERFLLILIGESELFWGE